MGRIRARQNHQGEDWQEAIVDAGGNTDVEDLDDDSIALLNAGDVNMDSQSGKRTADQAGLTSDSASKKPTMEAPTATGAIVQAKSGAVAASATMNGTGETPVDPVVRIERNLFTETRTAALPLTTYWSVNSVNKAVPVPFIMRLNAPYDVFTANTLVAQTINTAKTFGLSNTVSQEANDNNYGTIVAGTAFPFTVKGATASTATVSSSGAIVDSAAIPARRAMYDRIYSAYHVIECHWSVEMQYNHAGVNSGALVFEDYDSFTSTSIANKIPTDQSLMHYQQWRDVKTHKFGPRYVGNDRELSSRRVISGTWRPGVQKKDTKNEEEIKTWYPTEAGPTPLWVENLVLLFFADEDSRGGTGTQSFNIRVQQEWVIQYKDLKPTIRYPKLGDDDVVLVTFPDDTFQVPNVPELVPTPP